ncbi:hypothetical protein HGM15179_018542 [Zosterops borbonicus]|uniref:Uncharacterized protein n=1 Tax=Zosterops borbonicus TaxID=364589 RepID=A0A8K1FYV4_9PASS|nr:hypothetical protein HGM15179_018542 [Zosterops borbonicus]
MVFQHLRQVAVLDVLFGRDGQHNNDPNKGYVGAEPVSIDGVTGGLQQLTLLESKVSLTGKEWQKHPNVTTPEALGILGIDFLQNSHFKHPKGLKWAFGIAAVEEEGNRQLNASPRLSENPSAVGPLNVEEQHVQIATSMVHHQQYRTNQDAMIPIHKMIRELESQRLVSKVHSPITHKKNYFHWSPEQTKTFVQIKQKITHVVALGSVRRGQKVKSVLYSAAGSNGLSCSLWQKVPGETRG